MTKASVAAREHAIATKGAAGSTDVFVEKQKVVQAELESTATSSKIASISIKALSTAFNMFTGMAIMWGITKIIEGFEYLSESAERAKEKLSEIQTELNDNNSTYQSNRSTLVGLKEEYDALTKKAETLGGAQNLANDEYERYQTITSQILGITPKLTTGWNEEGEAISNKNNLLQASIDLLDEEYEKSLRNNTTKSKNEDVASGVIAELNEFNNSADTLSRSGTMYNMTSSLSNELKHIDKISKDLNDYDVAKQIYDYLYPENDGLRQGNHQNYIDSLISEIIDNKDYDKLADSFTDPNNPIYNLFSDKIIDDMIRNADAYYAEGQRIINDRETLYQDYKDQLNWNAQATRDKSGNNAYKQLTDNGKAFINEYIEGLDYASIKTEEDFVEMANDIQKFTKLLASNDDVSKLVENIFTPATENETSTQYVERVSKAIADIQQYCKDNYIDLPINFTTLNDVNRMTDGVQTFLSDEFDDKVGELSLEDLEIAYSKLEIDPSIPISWDELIAKIKEYKDSLKSYEDVNTSFSTIFNSSDFSEQKQSLLDLAKAGELTNKALSSDDYSDFIDKLEEIGVSADEAKTEIFSLLDATEKLSGASQTISGLEDAYNEFKEKGYVLAETIESIPDVFRQLETYDFDVFENIIGNPKNIEEMQGAFNDLVTAYISEMAVLSDVSETEAQRFISNLEEMGVTNADTVVNSVLALNDSMKATAKEAESTAQEINEFLVNVKGKAASATNDLTNCTWSEINALIEEGNKFGYTTSKIEEFAMQKLYANRQNLDVSDDIAGLVMLAETLGLCSEAVASYKKTVALANEGHGGGYGQAEAEAKMLSQKLRKEIEALYSPKYTPTVSYKAPTSSSSSSSSSSKEAEKTAEEIDWIEKLLERIQSRIDKLDKTASSTYRAWSTRNKALLDELKEVNGEIKAQQKAYDIYMAKANSVGLSEHYKQLVQNGDYKIEDITDDTLKDQISSYEEWYNKATDCSDAITDLKDRISELGMTQFENLVTQYEDQLSSYAHEVEMLQTYIDQTEAKGYDVSADYYKRLISVQESNIEGLKKEYESLKESLHSSVDTGKVVAYSESWYEMVDSIRNVQKSLEDANSSLIEYQNSLRELEWNKFDKLAEKISQIAEESDFLISLMSDEKMFTEEGITDEGQATLGLHAINYNTYLTKADEYAKQIAKINGELADDPHNDTLVDRRQELLDLQQQSILAAEDEKQAMKDLVSEGYDVFLESLQKIIDKRKDMLKDIKSLHDFEKSIAQQTSEISKLEKILKAYEGDNSEEARAKIQEYKVSLEEAKENLEETEYDRFIQDTEQILDKIMDDAQQFVSERLDNLSQLVSDVIDSTNENASEINETIKESADDVGYTISSKLANAFNSAGDGIGNLVSDYNDNFLETMTTLQASVDAIRSLIAGTSDKTASDKIASVEKSEKDIATTKGTWTKNDSGNWNYYKDGEQVKDSWTKYDKDNKWYHLDSEGNMSTSKWIKNDSGTWSYVNDLGQALTGWHKLDWQGSMDWYNFDDDGNMLENQWIDNYFVGKDGKMKTNTWIGHNGKYYWVGSDGKWLDKAGWTMDTKPLDGLPLYEYAKGSKRIPKDQLAWTQEEGTEIIHRASDGALLTPLGQDDMVFTNEASRKLWEFSQDPEGYMAKLGLSGLKPVEFAIPNISSMTKMPEIQRVAPNQNVNIQLGDIQMYGVNNPQEFAKQLRSTLATDTKTQKLLTEKIGSSFLGRTDRSNFYR